MEHCILYPDHDIFPCVGNAKQVFYAKIRGVCYFFQYINGVWEKQISPFYPKDITLEYCDESLLPSLKELVRHESPEWGIMDMCIKQADYLIKKESFWEE